MDTVIRHPNRYQAMWSEVREETEPRESYYVQRRRPGLGGTRIA